MKRQATMLRRRERGATDERVSAHCLPQRAQHAARAQSTTIDDDQLISSQF